ncbi:DUF1517 domain-containing protein [Synechococcus sp. WH 8101]|uniref:DUF1517 domain-containing protein n=1 Tax=Synechococcus sp. WH 8101 TaxID=59932 RepID=UPI00102339E0|nr:DUF1517 domain-containing protein [Synechococcus sp. WH 8101]QBE68346.1 DUF1517 domain-containing protein [Synechococcus sp. WH 8101]QNI44559.1 uncharacterized conserved glycin-rich membrane protein (DUF1517) [Synechococcus sp. WH 8101]
MPKHRSQSPLHPWLQRSLSILMIPLLLISVLIIQPQVSEAASGGRIGGGSFRAPSMPRSGGLNRSYGGGYSRGYGGGIGFPFIIPIFGFGGGGLFGFLILMAIVGVLVNAFRSAGSGGGTAIGGDRVNTINPGPVSLIQVQVGLLASAKALQSDLRQLAATADTSQASGLQRVLQDTTLALLRQPELWVYANAECGSVPFSAAESTFNRLSMTERSKLRQELTSNVGGVRTTSGDLAQRGDADATSEYIVVTLLVASRRPMTIKQADNGEALRETLRILGSTASSDLIALEVIWQPDGSGDVLSADELVTAYPNLQHL